MMTNEESIKRLESYKQAKCKGCCGHCGQCEFDEAIDMAIEALKEKINREHKIMKGTELLARLLDHEDCFEEVVHCKDCKFLFREETYGHRFCTIIPWRRYMTTDDGFCDRGERRENQ